MARQTCEIKSCPFEDIEFGSNSIVEGFSKVGFFQVGLIEDCAEEVRSLETCFSQVGLGKVYLTQSGLQKFRFFEGEIVKITVVEDAVF